MSQYGLPRSSREWNLPQYLGSGMLPVALCCMTTAIAYKLQAQLSPDDQEICTLGILLFFDSIDSVLVFEVEQIVRIAVGRLHTSQCPQPRRH